MGGVGGGSGLGLATGVRPAGLAFGRWLGDFAPLGAPEQRLVEACSAGELCTLNGGERPEVADEAYTIRAGVIRFLVLGGDAGHPVHERGVQLGGAWVDGKLDLRGAETRLALWLQDCRFAEEVVASGARLGGLNLNGSRLPSLTGDLMQVAGGVSLGKGFLDKRFVADGMVRMVGARIGGALNCSGGWFRNPHGVALDCERVEVALSLCLGVEFSAMREVRLEGARISGDLDCRGGRFRNRGGEANKGGDALNCRRAAITGSVLLIEGFGASGAVDMTGARIAGNFECTGGRFVNYRRNTLILDGANIAGTLKLWKACQGGAVSLASAKIGTLEDDAIFWTGNPDWKRPRPVLRHNLDGFCYDRFASQSSPEARVDWLMTQAPERLDHRDFAPQPWEQCSKVLREMGHRRDAAKVAIAKQELMRQIGKIGRPFNRRVWRTWLSPVQNGLHWLYGRLTGYGYRPQPLFVAMTVVWLVCGGLDEMAFYNGLFESTAAGAAKGDSNPCKPGVVQAPGAALASDSAHRPSNRAAPVSVSAIAAAATSPPPAPLARVCNAAKISAFQPYVYSLDVIVPVVHFGQHEAWQPVTGAPDGQPLLWGLALRWMIWLEIAFGWAASLVLVVVLGNLVKKD